MYSQSQFSFNPRGASMTALLRRLFFRSPSPAPLAAPATQFRPTITELDLLRALGCDE